MEKLSKFAIYLGIGMGVTFFVLFLIAALPGIMQNSIQQWEQLDNQSKSEEELKAKFQKHPAYQAMYERFPDAKEEITYHGGGNGNMRVGVMNFETKNQLILDMYYNQYDHRVNANINCVTNNSNLNQGVDSLFVIDYIKNTNCLEIVTASSVDSQGTMTPRSPVITEN